MELIASAQEFFFQSLTQYYGLDWIAMVTIFLSVYLLGNRRKIGFVFGVVGSVSWLAFNSLVDSWPGIVANAVLIVLHVRGFLEWEKRKKEEQET